MKPIALVVATAGGAGLSPFAPGTAGSAVGVVIYLLTSHLALEWQVGLLVFVSSVGVWASSVAARHYKRDDPGQAVVDEVAGQLLTLLGTGATWIGVVIGFLVFRVLDIIKPPPARQFEALQGGVGIMADDLMAGVYGNLLLHALFFAVPSLR